MRIILLFLLFTVNQVANGQRECGTAAYTQSQHADARTAQTLQLAEDFIEHQITTRESFRAENVTDASTIPVIRIPVVVHIIYNTASQNISDEQVHSQIAALNRDFRRKNPDASNTPERFRNVAADVYIEFVLATSDPYGGPTNGIVRKQTSVSSWTNDDKIKFTASGGANAWDSRSYLNIWVGNLRRLMGYASSPGAPADRDGLVIHTTAFGTINTTAPYNMGRTAVHETGHWLGLKHIWGDNYCGDDGVGDTPQQGNFTPGCPTGFRTSCSNGTNGDMYMNYMDFTYDACINMFTNGQATRMRASFLQGGPRYSLLASRGLDKPWTNGRPAPDQSINVSPVGLYPNPAATSVSVDTGEEPGWIGKTIRIVNMNGVTVRHAKITAKVQVIDLNTLPAGHYMLTGEQGGKRIATPFIKL